MNDRREAEIPLVVDVDGTLLSTDFLWEGGIRLLFDAPEKIPGSLAALATGRAPFKERVARAVSLNVEHLPLNRQVVELMRTAREQGRPLILASAAHRTQVEELSGRIGVDEVVASDGQTNLKGRTKLERLEERYDTFDYVGNSLSDIPILKVARKSYLVSPSPWTRWRTEAEGVDVELLGEDAPSFLKSLLRELRPHQWVKNLLLLLPVAAGHLSPTPDLALKVLLGLVTLSMAASAVYVINDLADLPADRQHESKQERPLAAGDLPIVIGIGMALLLAGGSLALAFTQPPAFAACVGVYLVLNLAYSLVLKERIVLDVMLLAALYTLRVIAGAALVEIPLTGWFLAFSIFLFLSLALLKRVVELERSDRGRKREIPGRAYRPSDAPLLKTAGVGAGLMSGVVYCLYIAGPEAEQLYARPELLWAGLPLFLYWLVRIWLLADRGDVEEDPVAHVVSDRVTYMVLAGFVGVVYLAA